MKRKRVLACLLLLALGSCQDAGKKKTVPAWVLPAGTYPDGAAGLKRLWSDILLAAQKDDRNRVHDLLASQAMSQAELARLFGAERGKQLWPRYDSLIISLANLGTIELSAQVYEKKYDDVAVVRVDEQPAAEQLPADQAVLAALVEKQPLYMVRLKRKTEDKGLRYDFFVYLDGHWRTGNLLGKYMEPDKKN